MTTRTALTTYASRAATTAVAAVAGYASYRHIAHVALMAGETAEVATVLPLAIDGLIVVGTMAMLADKANGRAPRASARVALGFGVVATLAANIASAQPTLLGRAVAAVPAIAFMLAVEVLARRGKLLPAEDAAEMEAAEAVEADAVEAADSEVPRPARRRPLPPRTRLSTADRVAAVVARHPGLKAPGVAAKLGIGERTARRYMPKPEAAETAAEPRVNGRFAGLFDTAEGAIA